MNYEPRWRPVIDPKEMIRLSSWIYNEVRRRQPRVIDLIQRSEAAVRRSRETIAEIERKYSI